MAALKSFVAIFILGAVLRVAAARGFSHHNVNRRLPSALGPWARPEVWESVSGWPWDGGGAEALLSGRHGVWSSQQGGEGGRFAICVLILHQVYLTTAVHAIHTLLLTPAVHVTCGTFALGLKYLHLQVAHNILVSRVSPCKKIILTHAAWAKGHGLREQGLAACRLVSLDTASNAGVRQVQVNR